MGDPLSECESQPATLDYASSQSNEGVFSRWVFVVGFALVIAAVVFLILLSPLNRTRPAATRVQCGFYERQLIGAITQYANGNQGKLPPTLQAAFPKISSSPQQSNLFSCPASAGAYVYLGAGLNLNTISRDTILIYEPPSNHPVAKTGKTTMNIAYADGRVQIIFSPVAEKIIAELKAGHNPPRAEKIR